MQIKTIKKNITDKLKAWLETITDTQLREDVKKNLLVSGGSIASMLLGEPVNDYDIFIRDMDVLKRLVFYYTKNIDGVTVLDGRNKAQLVEKVMEQYRGCPMHEEGRTIQDIKDVNNAYAICLRNLKDDQIKLFFDGKNGGMRFNEGKKPEELNYNVMFLSPNAISLSNDIQIVIRFWGDAEKIHSTFDYIHATNYFTFDKGIVVNSDALTSLLTKQLKYQGSQYPLTSIIRVRKFLKRGFNIGAGELLKIMYQISQLDLNDPDVLEEQLIGVDVAYFDIIIEALRGKKEADPDFKMTGDYLSAIIDKVFSDSEDGAQ